MCNAILEQKFGRAQVDSGLNNEHKSLNTFDKAVYYPTNWRAAHTVLLGKFPNFIRYGGLSAVAPEYLQKNYLGIFPIAEQPIIDEPKPFTRPRFS